MWSIKLKITQSVWPQQPSDYLVIRVRAKRWYLFKLLLWFHMWHIWGSNLFMFPQIQSQMRNYKITVGKNIQIGKKKKKRYIIGCGCLWISATLSQQVVPMVLHAGVYLIPPRGLPMIGPPKSCRPTQRLTLHSFFCKFCVPQNDCQVCVIRSTKMSVAPEMNDWNASLNWSDWSVRWP